jgi:TIR domain-containing protein/LGFP repeat-containing protein
MSTIFLSHNQKDKPFVRHLAEELKKKGVRVWLDEAEIKVGDSLIAKIQQGLDEMEYVGVILSNNSVGSAWVEKELETAMYQEINGRRVKVLPILIEDCKLPPFLNGKAYADFRSPLNYVRALEQLAASLGVNSEFVLPPDEGIHAINSLALNRNASITAIEIAPPSLMGTLSYRARVTDGKGVIYCHASGIRQGQAFYVRKGIGFFYEYMLNGSASLLGLPISNEELVDGEGFPTSYFENGFIDWSPTTGIARAILVTREGEKVIAQERL